VKGARRRKDGYGRGRSRRRSIIQLHFAGKFLAFASKSVGLSSCVSQTRPMAAFDIQARSEAEPDARAHLEGATLTKAHMRPHPLTRDRSEARG
jgi:hypothetical protein